MLINLLTNSIKFTRGQDTRRIEIYLCVSKERPPSDEGGNVVFITQRSARPEPTFGTQWDGGPVVFLQFNIKDTGKGLTEEEMNTLFHRFSQASPKTYGQYGGSGLGLFISRELTEMQGGQIGVSSKGTLQVLDQISFALAFISYDILTLNSWERLNVLLLSQGDQEHESAEEAR